MAQAGMEKRIGNYRPWLGKKMKKVFWKFKPSSDTVPRKTKQYL
jgi:hypothetical protein